jgi:HEAT repeat protein
MAYSWVVLPLLVGLAAILFYTTVLALTSADPDPCRLIEDVRYGSAAKRWQSAFHLARVMPYSAAAPDEERFLRAARAAFHETAGERDSAARQYMALALGRSGKRAFVPDLLRALEADPPRNRPYLIHALGLLEDPRAIPALTPFVQDLHAPVRLQAVFALGGIGDPSASDRVAPALADPELPIRWAAAVALAKLADSRGKPVLQQLLQGDDQVQFTGDPSEREEVMVAAVRAAALLDDPQLAAAIAQRGRHDRSMRVRAAALTALDAGSERVKP